MSSVTDEAPQRLEDSPVDPGLVTTELDAILSSQFFRGSRRYPALLKYVVNKTLEGQTGDLKERTLGVEVFQRPPAYDTNADPVVRSSASEVRKRLAQYYKDCGQTSQVQIELPLGSYVPEFKLRCVAPPELPISGVASDVSVVRRRPYLWWSAIGILAVLVVVVTYSVQKASPPKVADKLWGPLLSSPTSVLIVVGTSDWGASHQRPPDSYYTDHLRSPYHHISMSCAIALARVVGFLQARGKSYVIKDDREVSLTDLHARPVILIGGRNNPWTVRLTDPLRFRFDYGSLSRIEDRKKPTALKWGGRPDSGMASDAEGDSTDFAIFARYHDPTTDGVVMVIAGLGTFGTESASEFAVSPQYIDQLQSKGPADWGEKNLELVIKTEDISGDASPPQVIASTSW